MDDEDTSYGFDEDIERGAVPALETHPLVPGRDNGDLFAAGVADQAGNSRLTVNKNNAFANVAMQAAFTDGGHGCRRYVSILSKMSIWSEIV